jgi:signal-transduction protein with cAMP-binding, CBS, and nucleotidyltransferase domain
MNARSILQEKGFCVRSIEPNATVLEALQSMDEYKVGALMVISERHCARKVMLKELSSKSTRVSEVMEREPVQVSPEASLEECMAIMGKHRVRHVPVTEEGKVLGVISSNDLLNLALTQKDHIIQQLEQYIAPGP